MGQITSATKHITDHLPVGRYTADNIKAGIETAQINADEIFVKLSDVETFLIKLSNPKIVSQVVKQMMFGGDVDFEKLLGELK